MRSCEGAQLGVHVQPSLVGEGLGARALARPVPARRVSRQSPRRARTAAATHTPHSTLVCPSSTYADPAACETRPKLTTARRLSACVNETAPQAQTKLTGRAQAACSTAVGPRRGRRSRLKRRKRRIRFHAAAAAAPAGLPRSAHRAQWRQQQPTKRLIPSTTAEGKRARLHVARAAITLLSLTSAAHRAPRSGRHDLRHQLRVVPLLPGRRRRQRQPVRANAAHLAHLLCCADAPRDRNAARRRPRSSPRTRPAPTSPPSRSDAAAAADDGCVLPPSSAALWPQPAACAAYLTPRGTAHMVASRTSHGRPVLCARLLRPTSGALTLFALALADAALAP